MELRLRWQSPVGRHLERRFIEKIDFWRDFFPGNMTNELSNLDFGETYQESFDPGVLVAEYSEKNVKSFSRKMLLANQTASHVIPVAGNFYPKKYAWKALNSFPSDNTPFRLLQVSDTSVTADLNHPLASFPLTVEATMGERLKETTQRGGSANDIAVLLTENGPGMQVPHPDTIDSSATQYPLTRTDNGDDTLFYRSPRLVHHLDSAARSNLQSIYKNYLNSGMKVLDLMSSWESHIPGDITGCTVIGLGLNEAELRENKQLTSYDIHDLNTHPILPYKDGSFDAALCTVSIEYLTRPHEVVTEVARILKPGGVCIVTVSERWFPGKEIAPWADLHPFERQGLILKYFLQEKHFEKLHSESLRGIPRPADDQYSHQIQFSDALYVVSGRKVI